MDNATKIIGKLHIGYYAVALCGLILITAFARGVDILTTSISEQKVASDIARNTEKMMKSCLDAETGARGYIINRLVVNQKNSINSNDLEFLTPYQEGLKSFPRYHESALTQVEKDSSDYKRLITVKINFNEWTKMTKAILTNIDNPNKVKMVINETTTNERKRLMDAIREDVTEVAANQDRKLSEIFAATQGRKVFATWLVMLSSFGVVVVCLGLSTVLMRKAQSLEIIQERYRLALEASQAGLWDLDLNTNTLYLSPRWKSMLGYNENEIANNITSWEALIHPEDRSHAMNAFKDYIEGATQNYELEVRMKHRDGSYHTILTQGASLRKGSGKAYRIAGSHIDISDRKMREAYLAMLAKEQVDKEALALEEKAKIKPRKPRVSTPKTPVATKKPRTPAKKPPAKK